MPVDSTANLIDTLCQTRLLDPSQLDELKRVILPQCPDVRSLARALIERDWLTPYQINQLLQGCGRDLLLGQYVLQTRLNETLLGQAFRARHQHMKRLAVLTIVREKLLAQPEAVERFYQEIQAVSRLSHTNLACAFDAGPIGRSHFFALEFVEGIDLDQLIHQAGPLGVPLAAHLVRQVALGLQHAHERGLLHHDLKPANVLVTRLGGRGDPSKDDTPIPASAPLSETQIKVCNLGLTVLLPKPRNCDSGSSEDSLAGWYTASGSADFAPPEQAPGTPLTDIRSNLYSLGCILYYLLSGRVPFPGGNPIVTAAQHRGAEAQPLEEIRWDLPPEICLIVRKLMAKDAAARFQKPADLAAALAPWCSDGEASGTLAKAPDANSGLAGMRWRPWFGYAGAALALVLGLWFIISSVTSESSPEPDSNESKPAAPPAPVGLRYERRNTREETILATLKINNFPSLDGKWYWAGPFDNPDKKGFDIVYPPEQGVDLAATYTGKGGQKFGWKEFNNFPLGQVLDLKPLFPHPDNVCIYFYHELEAAEAVTLPASFGSDDTLTVWVNAEKPPVIAENVYRGAFPDQNRGNLKFKAGKNSVLIKICNGNGAFAIYVQPLWPEELQTIFGSRLNKDFRTRQGTETK